MLIVLSFSETVGQWKDFYLLLGTAGATLLGLLFVALSLRLNIFHQAEVADVRDFAAQVFGNFLGVVLISLVLLMPDARPAGVGLPLIAFGTIGVGWLWRTVHESIRLTTGNESEPLAGWRWSFFTVSLVMYIGLIACGGGLLAERTWVLAWLVVVDLALLTTAAVGAWILLARAGQT